jgi:hypothetical protein
VELRLEASHDFLWVEWTTFPPAVQLSEASYGFLAPCGSRPSICLDCLAFRVGSYFLVIPFKQSFITISRAFLRVYTRFLMCSLGSREWEKFFIVLDFTLIQHVICRDDIMLFH